MLFACRGVATVVAMICVSIVVAMRTWITYAQKKMCDGAGAPGRREAVGGYLSDHNEEDNKTVRAGSASGVSAKLAIASLSVSYDSRTLSSAVVRRRFRKAGPTCASL